MPTKPHKIDKYIPYFFVLFFLIIFIVNFTFIYIAKKNYPGVVEENSYNIGLKYQRVINQNDQFKDLGWKIEIKKQYLPDNYINLNINLLDKDQKPINNAQLLVNFYRPTKSGFDFAKQAQFTKKGNYQLKFKPPLKGSWLLKFEVKKDKKAFRDKIYLLI